MLDNNAVARTKQRRESRGAFEHSSGAPRLEEALCGRGCLIGRREELEEAESSFREAIRLIPDSAELWGNHGYFLAEQGRIAEGLGRLVSDKSRLAQLSADV